MYCRNCGSPIDPRAYACTQCGLGNGAGNNFCPNCGSQTHPDAIICVNCGIAFARPVDKTQQKSKLAAGLLALFLGSLGIHNFYLGYTGKAVGQLVGSLVGGLITCGVATAGIAIWALIEGILILSGVINMDAKGVPLKD